MGYTIILLDVWCGVGLNLFAMNTLVFELTMPNVGSWNGKWSGEKDYHAITRVLPKKLGPQRDMALTLIGRSFHYSWPDGWGANVSVRLVDSREAAVLRKRTKGFCSYDWMVDSLLQFGRIYADHQKPEVVSA